MDATYFEVILPSRLIVSKTQQIIHKLICLSFPIYIICPSIGIATHLQVIMNDWSSILIYRVQYHAWRNNFKDLHVGHPRCGCKSTNLVRDLYQMIRKWRNHSSYHVRDIYWNLVTSASPLHITNKYDNTAFLIGNPVKCINFWLDMPKQIFGSSPAAKWQGCLCQLHHTNSIVFSLWLKIWHFWAQVIPDAWWSDVFICVCLLLFGWSDS